MRYSLKQKVVLITGAAGGIGQALARELYVQGAQLVLTDMSAAALAALQAEFAAERVLVQTLDVTDAAACSELVAQAVAHFGRLDCVIANAGIAWSNAPATVLGCDVDEFERIVEVDLLGVWRTVKACLPEIVKQQGQVLVTSSIYAMINGMANAPYAASKAAVESLARSLRAELGSTGASASIIYPGWTATPIISVAFGGHALATRMNATALPRFLRRPIHPDALAQAVINGMQKRAPHIIAPARWRPVFWLRGLANPLTDAYLARHTSLQAMLRELDELSLNKPVAAVIKLRQASKRARKKLETNP